MRIRIAPRIHEFSKSMPAIRILSAASYINVGHFTETNEEENQVSYDVNYILICGPERELRKDWYERQ